MGLVETRSAAADWGSGSREEEEEEDLLPCGLG